MVSAKMSRSDVQDSPSDRTSIENKNNTMSLIFLTKIEAVEQNNA